ncbi:MAG: DUF3795 domain-containing protein [Oscillospiraceae bacterium]|nr:DUF3795 domain-containing protein [Oscillospiraceae bacterium]
MAETYCGIFCDSCGQKAQLECPGCRMGPGRTYGGDCDISKCCSTRGHHSCETCTTASTCIKLKNKQNVAQERLNRHNQDQTVLRQKVHNSELLGNFLNILFWVQIVSIICGVVMSVLENDPDYRLIGESVSCAFAVIYALILVRVGPVSSSYRIAGVCRLIGCALTFVSALSYDDFWVTLLGLIALVPSYIAQYQEFMGSCEVTEPYDQELSEKWKSLWFWALFGLVGMGVGLLLTLLGVILGAILVLVASAVTIVVEVRKLIILYKTAKLFREYHEINQYSV